MKTYRPTDLNAKIIMLLKIPILRHPCLESFTLVRHRARVKNIHFCGHFFQSFNNLSIFLKT